MKRKGIAVLLTAMTAVTVLVGCGKEGGNVLEEGHFTPPEATNPNKWQFDEPVTITFAKTLNIEEKDQMPEGQTSDDNVVLDYIEEKYNIRLVQAWTASDADYSQQLALHITSDELPDLFKCDDYTTFKSLVDTGMAQPISEAYINQASDFLLQIDKESNHTITESATINGHLYGIPSGNQLKTVHMLWLRQDWLDNLGMQVPTTLEEVEEVLRAFTYDDPDGNGKQDTYGLALNATNVVAESYVNFSLNPVFYNMCVYPEMWLQDEDGHVYNGSTDEKMKDVLTVLQRWYKEGYIDSEFTSRTGEGQVEGTISAGKPGAFFGQWWAIPRDQGILDQKWIAVLAPLAGDGKYYYQETDPFSSSYMVSSKCKNPEAAVAALAISLDISAEKEQEGYDRMMEATDGVRNRNLMCYGTYTTGLTSDIYMLSYGILNEINGDNYDTSGYEFTAYDLSEIEAVKSFLDGSKVDPDTAWSYYGRAIGFPLIWSDSLAGKKACWYWETDSSALINTLIDSAFDEAILKIITGQSEVSDYDNFIAQWHSLGGDTLIKEIEAELGIE